ncbi:family 78 glycoside hydrolase catalytic domain [Pseudarthrobacter raffinosi]|uniref:family 78 glycoside hydrolase catalytic domain n=1 Tax=Pseudarthrobacter raffinosi TaxID=2953651 RepID=UPI00208DF728|nr:MULTISPECIES: family 78 glycoside hydrolase catalytic domain [unclassified Pseudarthrobacter]MCO4252308.1 family 78 glycoside hydrolase catalytic domain [Pseudarthrobacter sp. MDT3-9]MCO4263212.1 family 78 glycoside hydrolase catalytic domain [Pseudarthrobacter sp. MDT3-26]
MGVSPTQEATPTLTRQGELRAGGLLTDSLSPCLTASLRPVFGWTLSQPDDASRAAARQTGYEIAVEDSAGAEVWHSGPMPSFRQAGIPYGGPDLAEDSDYSWRVRVSDAGGYASPWSEAASFSTGLSDSGWGADWIHRAPGGRAPLDVLEGALRVAGSPFLPIPCPPVRCFLLEARLRPVMGWAGLLLRSSGSGTGLLLELNTAGNVVLRRAPEWDIPAPATPDTDVLASAQLERNAAASQERLPGKDLVPGTWQDLTVSDDGTTITVTLDGVELLTVNEPLPAGFEGRLALHQGPRSQAEYASLRITDGARSGSAAGASVDTVSADATPGGAVLLDHRFSAGPEEARAFLGHWAGTTAHRQPDEWTLFRSTVLITGIVARARLFVAASHHAQVALDGNACLSTTSFGYPGEGYYDAADVTALLAAHTPGVPKQSGQQVQPALPGQRAQQQPVEIPLTALLHWYGPGQGRAASVPALLVRLSVDYTDGRREVFGSGSNWTAAEAPYRQAGYRNDEGDPVEHLDGQAAAALDASQDMPPALTYGPHPVPEFPALHPRRTSLSEEFVAPESFLTAADGTLVADFGRVIPARPEVDFRTGVAGRTLMIRAGYVLNADGRVDTGKTASQNTDMSFPYTQAQGPQRFRATVHLGFRYLELPGTEASDVTRVGAVVIHGRHPHEGSFSSSNPTLDAVFRLLRDSALHGVQEQFVDTPTREKGQFLADAVNISYATMALFGEHAYTAQALREFGWSAGRYWTDGADLGRYNAVYPNGDGKRDIPDFSLMMPEWAEEYHLRTGDLALVTELLPRLRATADYALRYLATEGPTAGLVAELGGGSGPYLHGIVDWPVPGRFGYDMDCAAKTTVNAQAYSALISTARLCSLAGQEDAAVRYAGRAGALAESIRTRLRVGGVMVDGLHADGTPSTHASQHATSFPLSLGITDSDYATADAERIAGQGMRQGPMTVHRLVRALLSEGRTEAVLDLLTSPDQPGWARLLESGASFTWEAWELVDGTDYSQSHAWSASVVKEILEFLLGVRVSVPGGTEVIIEPPVCSLEHAKGNVPLPNGAVDVAWRRTATGIQLECTIPAGVTATVRLPSGGTYGIQGPTAGPAVVHSGSGGAANSGERGGAGTINGKTSRDFRIHTGSWTFTPSNEP